MSRWNPPIALYLFLVFISGGVVGALGYRLYSPPAAKSNAAKISPEEWRRQYLEEAQTRIGLTPAQMKQFNEIMDESKKRVDEAHDKQHQIMEQIREEQRAKARAIMTPEQLPKYEQFRADRDARAKAGQKK